MSAATAFRDLDESSSALPGSYSTTAGIGVRGGDRRALRKPAHLRCSTADLGVRTLNVGSGGMAVVAPFNPAVGTRSFVHFDLPIRDQGNAELGLACSVAHSIYSHRESGFVIGLEFEELPEAAEQLLQRFLNV